MYYLAKVYNERGTNIPKLSVRLDEQTIVKNPQLISFDNVKQCSVRKHLLFDVSVGSRTPQLIGCFYLQLIVLCYYYVHHVPIV
jgi:hypothetical protein